MPAILGILETAIYCADLNAAASFYGEVIGLREISRKDGRHIFYACGEGVLLVFNPESTSTVGVPVGDQEIPKHGTVGRGHLCFNVSHDERNTWKNYLVRQGVEIESEIRWRPGVESIYVRDPAGNSVEFATRELWFSES